MDGKRKRPAVGPVAGGEKTNGTALPGKMGGKTPTSSSRQRNQKGGKTFSPLGEKREPSGCVLPKGQGEERKNEDVPCTAKEIGSSYQKKEKIFLFTWI